MIKVGFTFENEFGHKFSQTSELEVFDDFGDDEISSIGRQMNTFLAQCGYYRDKDCIFMESVSEEELCLLSEYLYTIRHEEVCDDNN